MSTRSQKQRKNSNQLFSISLTKQPSTPISRLFSDLKCPTPPRKYVTPTTPLQTYLGESFIEDSPSPTSPDPTPPVRTSAKKPLIPRYCPIPTRSRKPAWLLRYGSSCPPGPKHPGFKEYTRLGCRRNEYVEFLFYAVCDLLQRDTLKSLSRFRTRSPLGIASGKLKGVWKADDQADPRGWTGEERDNLRGNDA